MQWWVCMRALTPCKHQSFCIINYSYGYGLMSITALFATKCMVFWCSFAITLLSGPPQLNVKLRIKTRSPTMNVHHLCTKSIIHAQTHFIPRFHTYRASISMKENFTKGSFSCILLVEVFVSEISAILELQCAHQHQGGLESLHGCCQCSRFCSAVTTYWCMDLLPHSYSGEVLIKCIVILCFTHWILACS